MNRNCYISLVVVKCTESQQKQDKQVIPCTSLIAVILRGSTVGQGAIAPPLPPNLGLVPKCDMKHYLTDSKHRHIGAKRSVLWPSKYTKVGFRPADRAHNAPTDP